LCCGVPDGTQEKKYIDDSGEVESVRFAQHFQAEACRPSIVSNFIVVDTVMNRVGVTPNTSNERCDDAQF
jgi:hypothetical protein